MVETMEEATVDYLINEEARTWNVEMIDGIFAPQEAEEIKNIPLAREETEDSLYWPWEHDGRYSCKTGYRFLKEDEVGFQVSGHQDNEEGLWKKVWALDCPNKVKNIIWRACRNSLPTKCNLYRRTIITEECCDRCKEETEDFLHAVWSCKKLDGVWGVNSLWHFRNQQRFASFSELMAWVFDHHRKPGLFAFNIWSIWHQRNQVRTHQAHRPLHQISQWALDSFVEFQALKMAPPPSRPVRRARWKPPDQGSLKINFDGAIFADENCSGLGVVIRDGKGLVLASMAARVPQQLRPEEIEALAASRALEFARELDVSDAVLEGDSLMVISALKLKNFGLAPFGLLLQDSLAFSSGFTKLSYSHTKREGNTVAHNLAKLAVNFTSCVIWMEDVPPVVMTSYQADLAGFS